MSNMNRNPAGTPAGGQFAGFNRAEAEGVELSGTPATYADDINERLRALAGTDQAEFQRVWADAGEEFAAQVADGIPVSGGEMSGALASFHNALDRRLEEKAEAKAADQIAPSVSAAVDHVGDASRNLGIDFKHVPGSEFNEWSAYVSGGDRVTISPNDPNWVALEDGETGMVYEASLPDDESGTYPNFYGSDASRDLWNAQMQPAVSAIKKGANLKALAARLDGTNPHAVMFPKELPEDAPPADVFTAIPDCSRVNVEVQLPNGQDGTVIIRGLVRDIPRWGTDMAGENRRVTTESGFESFIDPATVVSIEVTDQSRVSPQRW